jgi:hypothetical protein
MIERALKLAGNLRRAAGTWVLRLRALPVVLYMIICMALPAARAQQGANSQVPVAPPHGFPQQDNTPFSSMDGSNPVEVEKRMHMINSERQKSLIADTNRLLALATELNSEIAKSNTGELTPDQIRKVAEIEKLAHNVKDKMSMSLRGPTMNLDNSPFMPSLH